MSTFLEKWNAVILTEQLRFQMDDVNLVGFAFGKISRSYEFLLISVEEFERASMALAAGVGIQLQQPKRGVHEMTTEEIAIADARRKTTVRLHFAIETFYLHAKILLDNIARAVEFYFGPVRGLSLDSHDDLVKRMAQYTGAWQLDEPSDELLNVIGRLKADVSDYRDYQIAHDKSPRSMKMTVLSWRDPRSSRILNTRLYPSGDDVQVESRRLNELLGEIESYMELVTSWIARNWARSARDLKDRPPAPSV